MQGSVLDYGVGETTGFTAPCKAGHAGAQWVTVTQATVRYVRGQHLPLTPEDWTTETYVDFCQTCWDASIARTRALIAEERARQERISDLQVIHYGEVLF